MKSKGGDQMDLCLHNNLRMLRQKHGFSLEALAEIISVSRQTVAKWESGDSYPELINCIKLADLYKLSLDELVNKPLGDMMEGNLLGPEGGRICGVLEIDENNSIRLPQPVMEMFGINTGENILLLADKKQGIALVKCRKF